MTVAAVSAAGDQYGHLTSDDLPEPPGWCPPIPTAADPDTGPPVVDPSPEPLVDAADRFLWLNAYQPVYPAAAPGRRVEAGDLDERGRSLFDAAAIGGVLDSLFTEPPAELVSLVASRLDHRVDDDRVRDALIRVGGRLFTDTPPPPPVTTTAASKPPGSRKQGPRRPHTYEEHFGSASAAVVDLYERFHEAVMAKDPRMVREFKARAVNYALGEGKGSIVVTVVPQANRLKLFLVLPGSRADGHADLRDVTNVGHHGYGDVQAALTPDNFEDRLALVDEALAAHAARA